MCEFNLLKTKVLKKNLSRIKVLKRKSFKPNCRFILLFYFWFSIWSETLLIGQVKIGGREWLERRGVSASENGRSLAYSVCVCRLGASGKRQYCSLPPFPCLRSWVSEWALQLTSIRETNSFRSQSENPSFYGTYWYALQITPLLFIHSSILHTWQYHTYSSIPSFLFPFHARATIQIVPHLLYPPPLDPTCNHSPTSISQSPSPDTNKNFLPFCCAAFRPIPFISLFYIVLFFCHSHQRL